MYIWICLAGVRVAWAYLPNIPLDISQLQAWCTEALGNCRKIDENSKLFSPDSRGVRLASFHVTWRENVPGKKCSAVITSTLYHRALFSSSELVFCANIMLHVIILCNIICLEVFKVTSGMVKIDKCVNYAWISRQRVDYSFGMFFYRTLPFLTLFIPSFAEMFKGVDKKGENKSWNCYRKKIIQIFK